MDSNRDAGTVRWVDYARRSMQRLGFVRWSLKFASSAGSQNLESLTRQFAESVTKLVPIPPDAREAFDRYARTEVRARAGNSIDRAQAQDIFLADPELPSHSGAMTGDLERKGYRHSVYVEMPTWAVRLRLLRPQNYTLTDRGRIFLLSGPQYGVSDSSKPNPLYLDLRAQYLALSFLLDVDGDFLSALYSRLLHLSSFSRLTAGEAALEALNHLRTTRLRRVGVGPLNELAIKMDKAIASMQAQRTGTGPRESIITPRTEPLVDCGILSKDPERYEYAFTDWGRRFLDALVQASSVSDFIERHLSSVFACRTGQEIDITPELAAVGPCYAQLRAGLGYVSVRELATCTVAQSLSPQASSKISEIAAIEQMLKKAAAEDSRRVRLAVGRAGGKSQVRIDQRALG